MAVLAFIEAIISKLSEMPASYVHLWGFLVGAIHRALGRWVIRKRAHRQLHVRRLADDLWRQGRGQAILEFFAFSCDVVHAYCSDELEESELDIQVNIIRGNYLDEIGVLVGAKNFQELGGILCSQNRRKVTFKCNGSVIKK